MPVKRRRITAVWHEPLIMSYFCFFFFFLLSYFLIPKYNYHVLSAHYVLGTVLGILLYYKL